MDYMKIYQTQVPNARKTLDKPVPLDMVHEQITDPHLKEDFKRLLNFKKLYFWISVSGQPKN
jgi:hypothetical protein